jgi:DNA-binding transcriptional LysR family regulator
MKGLGLRAQAQGGQQYRIKGVRTTCSAFAPHALPELVRRYRETRPSMDVRIREGRQSEIVEDVRSGVADFGIGYVNTLPDMLQAAMLRKEPLYAVVPSCAAGISRQPQRA